MRCAVYHGYTHRLYELRPKTVLKLLAGLDAFRRPQRLRDFLIVCESDYRGREGFHERPYPQAPDLWRLYEAASGISVEGATDDMAGWLKGEAIRRQRIQRIAEMLPELQRAAAASAGQPVEDAETGDIGADGGAEGTEEKDQ